MKPDPLLYKERQAIADELTSSMRHDVRNRLSTIRNAAFYLKRRVSQTELWTSDACVQQFFSLIDESVAHAEQLLTARFGARAADGAEAEATSGAGALAKAVASARVAPGVTFDVAADDADVYVDADELALGVRCLLESAAAGLAQPGVVSVRALRTAAGYAVEVSPWAGANPSAEGDGMSPGQRWEEGGDGPGVHLAARVARCYGGSLETSSEPAGGRVSLTVPLEPHESPQLPPAAP